MNLKEPESEDHLNFMDKRDKSNLRSTSKGRVQPLDGLVSQEFMRQLDCNFMAKKEERIANWERMGRSQSQEKSNTRWT